ncbi:MAG: hypothetical protein LUD17_05665 [Bacteroidales bacterium]|nr:hypothetical protein [Bacteroidales bacterium]
MKKFNLFVTIFLILTLQSCGSFGEGFLAGMGGYSPMGYSSYGGYNAYTANSMPGANASLQEVNNWAMASAIQQTNAQNAQMQQVSNWAMSSAIQQTNAQEEEAYQWFLNATGSNISKDEWRMLVAQAYAESNGNDTSYGSTSYGSSNGSYTSSSSSTSSRRKCIPTLSQWGGSTDHSYCYGSGKCHNCNGRGYVESFGNTVQCTYCKSSGKCQRCHGSGYLD